MSKPIRVVYDCMILLQAASRPDRVHGTMKALDEGRIALCSSLDTLEELRDVLNRPELRAKFPLLTSDVASAFIGSVVAKSLIFNDVPRSFALNRDPKDEPYINLAIKAEARFLVTWNERHMTYLMRRDTPEGIDFCNRFPSLAILNPVDFLQAVRS